MLELMTHTNIFNGMSILENIMFCIPATHIFPFSNIQKYTEVKQLWLNPSATITLTRTTGTAKLISTGFGRLKKLFHTLMTNIFFCSFFLF